jgi:hypothetical protein
MITPRARAKLTHGDILKGMLRHVVCDWGDVSEYTRQQNEAYLKLNLCVLSAFTSLGGTKFWILTELGRVATTVLLPEDHYSANS